MLVDESGKELAKGEAEVKLENERLIVLPKFGETTYLSLIDILEVVSEDYEVALGLSSRERISITDLGYKFTDFITSLSNFRNEMILKYLLMNESIKKAGVSGDLTIADPAAVERQLGICELRLYETSIVFIPSKADPIRIRYSDIAKSEAVDYRLAITTEDGWVYIVSKMGKEFDSTARDLSSAMNALTVQSQSMIKDLVPTADPSVVRTLSRLMKDGKAARKSDIESISQDVWAALEKKLEDTPIWSAYEYLKSISRQEKIAAGIKRGLMGDLTGNYIWVLFPLYGKDSANGNAVALEAARVSSDPIEGDSASGAEIEPGGGNATYFFRISSRKDYAGTNVGELDPKVDGIISKINRLMLDINFRREPILLSDDQLREPKHAKYRYAAQKLASLRDIRLLFIGRVIHSSFDQWKSDVTDLLAFNVSAGDDNAKWKKSD